MRNLWLASDLPLSMRVVARQHRRHEAAMTMWQRKARRFGGLLAGVWALAGCAGRLSVDQLEAQAARELACPESQVRGRVTSSGRFYGVARGCGREQSYELWCALN